MDDLKTLESRISRLEGIIGKQQQALRTIADALSGHQKILEDLKADSAGRPRPVPVPMLVN